MNAIAELQAPISSSALDINLTSQSDRRADVDAKQTLIAEFLKDVGCDGLLVLARRISRG